MTRPRTRSGWAVEVAAIGSIVAFAFLAGPWAFTSYYLRYALLGLFALTVHFSYRRARLNRTAGQDETAGRLAFSTPILVLFTVLDALAIASHLGPRESLNMSLPLASGTYYVLQGGNSVVTNPFHALSGSRFALDIVRLNTFGNRAKGVAPRALADYEIFGDNVYSPCEGTVVGVRDHLPDTAPGNPDAEHPEGNYVIVECAEVEILMAHLMRGSALVAAGKAVALEQPLGKVGNSGNSLEPHLHIGAKKRGVETGLAFAGRWLSANSVVIGARRDAQTVAAADRSRAGGR